MGFDSTSNLRFQLECVAFRRGNGCTSLPPQSDLTIVQASMKRMLCLALFFAVAAISSNAAEPSGNLTPRL